MRASTPGDEVLVTGCGLSETHDGGYAEVRARAGRLGDPHAARASTPASAMAIGTAGFTAALAIHRMEQNGQSPQGGPIVVTGATGGVGSIAIDMLARRGYEVVAVSGKAAAARVPASSSAPARCCARRDSTRHAAAESARFGGAIDNVGGEMLTWLTRTVDCWGNIASIGLAGGH